MQRNRIDEPSLQELYRDGSERQTPFSEAGAAR